MLAQTGNKLRDGATDNIIMQWFSYWICLRATAVYLILAELGAAVISSPVSRGDMSSFEQGRRELSIRPETVRAGGLRISGICHVPTSGMGSLWPVLKAPSQHQVRWLKELALK